jgi:hypothetical protein
MPYILLSKVPEYEYGHCCHWNQSSILAWFNISTYCHFQYEPKPSSPLLLSLSLHKYNGDENRENLCDFL